MTDVLSLNNSNYDGNGNLLQVDNNLAQVSNIYSYDALNRLDTANGTFGQQGFSYDKNANRIEFSQDSVPVSYTYKPNSNRLTQAANDAITIDANGNTLTKGLWTYTPNSLNRLVQVSYDGNLVGSYAYNGLGQRISKNVSGVITDFVYGLQGELLSETTNGIVTNYVYLNGQPLAVVKQGNVYYIHNDHLGTPRVVSDSSGTALWSWYSDPFGATAANDDVDNNGTAFTFNLRFPGQYYDAESGLHYNYFRDYDPSTGRYIQSDPIGLEGGLNTYGYVGGNPVIYSDSYGLYVDPTVAFTKAATRQAATKVGLAGLGPFGIGISIAGLVADGLMPGYTSVVDVPNITASNDEYGFCPKPADPDGPDDCELKRNFLILEEIRIKEDARGAPRGANEIQYFNNIRARKKAWNEAVDKYNRECPKKIPWRFRDV